MLLFAKPFWEGLKNGTITLTFRTWAKSRVLAGRRYRCHPIGVLEVDAVDRVRLSEVTEREAREAGFPDRAALVAYLGEVTEGPPGPELPLFRVKLHYAGDGDRVPGALEEPTAEEVEGLVARLEKLDARAAAPWTRTTLGLLEKRPHVAASQLAKSVGRETAPFKADVVKLKRLGLSQSFEVGYELTPRGRAVLARMRTRRRRPRAK